MFLAMHITNQKLSVDIFKVRNYFDLYDVFLAIATNKPVLLMTGLSRITFI